MRKTAENTIKVLAKRVFVLLLTGLLLLPGNDVYAIGNRTTVEVELPDGVGLLECVESPDGAELPENGELLVGTEVPEAIELPEDEGLSARAPVYPQNVTYLTVKHITSKDKDGKVVWSKDIDIPYTTNKSLWFKDGKLANQIIRTYNDPSRLYPVGGIVEIDVYQEGTYNLYTRVDGENFRVSREEIKSDIRPTFQSYTTRFTIDYTIAEEPYTIFTAGSIQLTDSGSSTPYTRHEVNVYIYWDRSYLPDAPNVSFAYDSAADKMVLSGADSTMEYRLKSETTKDWKPCTDEPLYFDVTGTASETYFVRYASPGEGEKASQVKEIVLPGKKAAPSASYDSTTETFSGLSTSMEVQFGDGSYEPITGKTLNVSDRIDTIADGETLSVNIRQKGTATLPSGLIKSFTLYPRLAAPASITFNPAPLTLTGCSSAMQYRTDTQTAWTNLSSSTLYLANFASAERDVVVYVRTKPTTKNAASKPIEFTIPKLLEGPSGTVEYDNEIISGLEPGAYQYSLNSTSWTNLNITDGTWKLSSLITTSARTIYLRKAATTTTPITAYTVFKIPRRPVAPTTPKFIYNDVDNPDKIIFSGLTTDMEYRRSTDTDWTNVPASGLVYDPQTTSVIYYVRNKATTDTWASAYKSVTMTAMPKAPTISYNKSTETLTKLGTAYEISFDGGAYTALTSSTYNLSAQIDNIPSNGALLVSVRRRATSTAPAGLVATLTVYARETTAADTSELEDELVVPPEVDEVPEVTPEVEGTPEATPEAEGTPENVPEVESTPESMAEIEGAFEVIPEVESAPETSVR